MTNDALFWLSATLFWTLIMSFYSTQEMACISYNKLRLEYAVKQGKRWAKWLHYLIENPGILFSTTLIGVNVALMASSECARRLYEALGLNPNFAPLTHIPFILLFGELVPMFAARIHAEHMCRLGIPFLFLSAQILTPLTKIVDFCFHHLKRYAGAKEARKSLLNRDELQKLIEEHEIGPTADFDTQFNAIIGNIFSLRSKNATLLMEKLNQVPCLASHTLVGQVRELLKKIEERYILVFHRAPQKIIGVLLAQDLLEAQDHKKIADYIRPACFVSENAHGLELLTRLQDEQLPVACVLDREGAAIGAITLDDIFEELFASSEAVTEQKKTHLTYLEKTFAGDTKIKDFNKAYGMDIDPQGCNTFSELLEQALGRNPAVGDTIFVEPVEITVKETSLFKAKTILICSRHQ